MLKSGYVRVERSITRWRWYQNSNTFRLFIHLILTANYEDRQFENITVHRGQRVTSRAVLAGELGVSEQNIRTALRHLESTGEITSSGTSKFTVITINHYDKYQSSASTLTNDQPAADQQPASDQPQCKKDKKDKKDHKEKKILPKQKYGEYQNVLLSDEDMQKLKAEFPYDWQQRIERLSGYMESTGKSYKNHLATIRNWAKKDMGQQGTGQNIPVRTESESSEMDCVIEFW